MAAMRLTLPRLCDTILIYVKRKGERIVPDWKENKYVKISLCAFAVIAASVLLVLVAMNLGLIMHWLGLLLDIVAPFLWGFFFAYILNYPYKWLLRVINKIPKLSQKMSDGAKRGTAVSVLYAVFIALTGLFFYAVVPQIDRFRKRRNAVPIHQILKCLRHRNISASVSVCLDNRVGFRSRFYVGDQRLCIGSHSIQIDRLI